MQLCLREIWFLSAFYDFEITAVHIPRLDNSLADHLSRWHLSPIHKVQFHQLTSHTSTTQVVFPTRFFDFPADINQPPVPRFTQSLTPANLAVLVSQVQAHAYDPGTLRNLHSQWKSFLHFCSTYHVTPLPAAPHIVASHACYLSHKTSSYQYILNHLNAVRLLHHFNGCSVDALETFDVTLTKRGFPPKTSHHPANTDGHPPSFGHKSSFSLRAMGVILHSFLFLSSQVELGDSLGRLL